MGKKKRTRTRSGGGGGGGGGSTGGGGNRRGSGGNGGNRRGGRRRRGAGGDTAVEPAAGMPDPVSENGEPMPPEPGSGMLELHPNGYGFLRSPDNNYARDRSDPFVPGTMIEKLRPP